MVYFIIIRLLKEENKRLFGISVFRKIGKQKNYAEKYS